MGDNHEQAGPEAIRKSKDKEMILQHQCGSRRSLLHVQETDPRSWDRDKKIEWRKIMPIRHIVLPPRICRFY